ncbi:MAG: hypothetical protein KAG97_12275, partial [Victivallales bacterium]|nr:hypothetical protein [Victivallales bacterium]
MDSYNNFLQRDVPPEKREGGLEEVFKEVFPIKSFDSQIVLDYVSYRLGEINGDAIDCIKDGETHSVPLYATFRLKREGGEIIEEEVFIGDIPIITEGGTFVVNGVERVIISQLHRSPGICFETSQHTSGATLYSFRIIPDRGSWMEVQFDINNLIYIYMDRRRRRRKFLITTFLRAIGYETNKEILASTYDIKKMTIAALLKVDDLNTYYTIDPITDDAGTIILDECVELNEAHLETLKNSGVKKLELCHIPDGDNYLITCLRKDPPRTRDEALKEIYRRMRPGDPPSIPNAKQLLHRLFFDIRRYDLGRVGRFKLNKTFGQNISLDERVLRKEDMLGATKMLVKLKASSRAPDDIDHLGNRRVRNVGELLQNQCRVGLSRTERLIKERMTLLGSDGTTMTATKLVNPKAFAGVVRDFFARNQLSQFMDQTNPLSELTNKRRMSALGPGGLSRERAGFEVRDVHVSHYGRICPIETPEGPNIGLISSMSLYSRINDFGFLETPYRLVKDGIVTDKIEHLTADQETEYVIAQANAALNADGRFTNETVMARYRGDSREVPKENVQYMDVSPKQLVSPAAGLIPFLEHDDANRA